MSYTVEKKKGFPIANDPEVLVFHISDDCTPDSNAGGWLERGYIRAAARVKSTFGRTVGEFVRMNERFRELARELKKF